VAKIEDERLRKAVTACVYQTEGRLKDAPAAKGNHQAYLGGLMEHVLRLCRLVEKLCEVYPDLNRDVLLAGAVLHDMGKCFELCYSEHIGYSREGELVGHIVQGSVYWDRFAGELDPAMRDHVAHLIASHHGVKDWGAAALPMTREAQLFHYLDMLDSRYEMFGNLVAAGVDAEGWTAWDHKLGIRVWNGKER
jgi:3'-5' exoribonuclease